MKYTLTINTITDKVKELLAKIEENEEMQLESSDFWCDLSKKEETAVVDSKFLLEINI